MNRKQRVVVLVAGLAVACLALWAARKPAALPVSSMPAPAAASLPPTKLEESPTEPAESPVPRIAFPFGGPVAESGVPAEWSPTVSAGKLQVKVVTPEEESGGGTAASSALWLHSEGASFLLTN